MAEKFTPIYDAIVRAFRDNAKGSFRLVDWNSTRNPQLDSPTAQDFPEVQLRPLGMRPVLGGRSCSTTVELDYSLTIVTGDFILGKLLNPTDWRILCILHSLQYSLVEQLGIAEDVSVVQSTTGTLDPNGNRGIVGWASNWTITVATSFTAAQLEL